VNESDPEKRGENTPEISAHRSEKGRMKKSVGGGWPINTGGLRPPSAGDVKKEGINRKIPITCGRL